MELEYTAPAREPGAALSDSETFPADSGSPSTPGARDTGRRAVSRLPAGRRA